jgi:hypothetical protein
MTSPQDALQRVDGIFDGLRDGLSLARGSDRLELAKCAVREARLALEATSGPEVEVLRAAFAALEAAFVEILP